MWKFALIFLVFLTGCAVLCPPQPPVSCQEQDVFGAALDAFQKTDNISDLEKFRSDYPDSLWSDRAGLIIDSTRRLNRCREKLEKIQKDSVQRDTQIDQLKKTNQQLAQQLEQLKGLLIELEKHPQ